MYQSNRYVHRRWPCFQNIICYIKYHWCQPLKYQLELKQHRSRISSIRNMIHFCQCKFHSKPSSPEFILYLFFAPHHLKTFDKFGCTWMLSEVYLIKQMLNRTPTAIQSWKAAHSLNKTHSKLHITQTPQSSTEIQFFRSPQIEAHY